MKFLLGLLLGVGLGYAVTTYINQIIREEEEENLA
jgi:hypothetical protein